MIEVLDRYLTEMSDAILDEDGTVVSYMGDGIMAVFGAPIADDDHATKALTAAREMIGPRLEAFNGWLAAEGMAADGVRMGIGLASGPLMSGSVGSDRRLEYAAVGDTTNLAARLEAATKEWVTTCWCRPPRASWRARTCRRREGGRCAGGPGTRRDVRAAADRRTAVGPDSIAARSTTIVRPAGKLQRALLLLGAQGAVDGDPRGPGEVGKVLLGQRDRDVAVLGLGDGVDLGHVHQPPQHAAVGRDVQRLPQLLREPAHLGGQHGDQHVGRLRRLLPQAREVQLVHRQRLQRLQRRDRGAAGGVLVQQRQLAEHLPRAQHRRDHRLAPAGVQAHRHTAAADQVQRVGRIALVEHDLARAKFRLRAMSARAHVSCSGKGTAELDTVDLRFGLRGDQARPKDIVLVAIDFQSLQELRRLLPLPRRLHARAIDRLDRAGARAIVYDVQFTEPTDAADDNALFDAIQRAGNVVLATSEVREDGGTDVLGGPANQRAAGAVVGNAALSKADSDRVIRRYARSTDGLDSLAVVAARRLDGRAPPRGPFRPDGAWIDYPGPPGTIDTVRFSHLLAGRVPASRLRGKTAVVGVTDPNAKDVYATPGSGSEVMAGAEVQAHALDTIRRDFPLRELPDGAAALFAAVFGLAMPVAALRVRRWPWLAPAAAVVLGAIAYLAFLSGLIVPVAAPLAALAVGTLAALAVDLATGLRARERMRGAFARFVPAQIVDDVIGRTGDDYRLTGDRLEATVLFCDLRGFTSLAESLDAERVIEVLDRYLTEMSDAILDQDGTVVSYMGDGIMAVFGAPIADEGHAAKAVAAAREMIGPRLEAFNAWLAAEGVAADGVRMGIGLASGPVMSGSVGSDRRLEYAAVGDTTNLAARLEAATKDTEHDVLMSKATRDLAGEELPAAGTVKVRGRTGTVETFALGPSSPAGGRTPAT